MINVKIGDSRTTVMKNLENEDVNYGVLDDDDTIGTYRSMELDGIMHPFVYKKYIFFNNESANKYECRVKRIKSEIAIKWINDEYCLRFSDN
jgi:hypothetical protein